MAIKKDFEKKYKSQILGLSKANKVDLGQASSMLKSNINNTIRGSGTIYKGGGTLDMNKAYSDLNKIGQPQPTQYAKAKTQSFKAPTFGDTIGRGEAVGQATTELRPEIQSIKNKLISNVLATKTKLPQTLSTRGQALGGQRELAEADVSTQEALGMADIGLRGEQAIQERATEVQALSYDQASKQYARELQTYESNLARADVQEERKYRNDRDEIADARYIAETEWNKSMDNPAFKSLLLNLQIDEKEVANYDEDRKLEIAGIESDLRYGAINEERARLELNNLKSGLTASGASTGADVVPITLDSTDTAKFDSVLATLQGYARTNSGYAFLKKNKDGIISGIGPDGYAKLVENNKSLLKTNFENALANGKGYQFLNSNGFAIQETFGTDTAAFMEDANDRVYKFGSAGTKVIEDDTKDTGWFK